MAWLSLCNGSHNNVKKKEKIAKRSLFNCIFSMVKGKSKRKTESSQALHVEKAPPGLSDAVDHANATRRKAEENHGSKSPLNGKPIPSLALQDNTIKQMRDEKEKEKAGKPSINLPHPSDNCLSIALDNAEEHDGEDTMAHEQEFKRNNGNASYSSAEFFTLDHENVDEVGRDSFDFSKQRAAAGLMTSGKLQQRNNVSSQRSSSFGIDLSLGTLEEWQENSLAKLKEEITDEGDNHAPLEAGYESYNFSPIELERRLHELLVKKQEEQINELESRLKSIETELLFKDKEVCWWKEHVSKVLQEKHDSVILPDHIGKQIFLSLPDMKHGHDQGNHNLQQHSRNWLSWGTCDDLKAIEAEKEDSLSEGYDFIDLESKTSAKDSSFEWETTNIRKSSFGKTSNLSKEKDMPKNALDAPFVLQDIILQHQRDSDSSVPDSNSSFEKIYGTSNVSMLTLPRGW